MLSVTTFEKSDWQNNLPFSLGTLLETGRFKTKSKRFLKNKRVITQVAYKRISGNAAYEIDFLKLKFLKRAESEKSLFKPFLLAFRLNILLLQPSQHHLHS